jgi:hypothetical protein
LIPRSTFAYWLDPEPHRERQRQRYANDFDYRERHNKCHRDRYYRLQDEGLCTNCRGPILSEAYCMDCLSGKSFSAARRAATLTGWDGSRG